MNRLVDKDPPVPEPPPEDIVEVAVCPLSGKLPGPHCAHTRAVHVPRDHAPTETCDWHREVAIDIRNGLRAGDRCPARFVEHRVFETLPATYAQWLATAADRAKPPAEYSPLCPASGVVPGAVVITYPRDREVFLLEPGYDAKTQTLPLTAEIDPPVAEATWLVDGERIAGGSRAPYETSWPLRAGKHRVQVVAGGRTSDPIEFEVR
jgi:penicillin-binding protein 1C